MSKGLEVEFKVHFGRGPSGRRDLREGEAPPKFETPEGNVPRISRLMALAIRFEELIRSGEVQDYSELARLGHVTRARMSQIMNLLNLAPDIQEELLFLPPTTKGRDAVGERDLRRIAIIPIWSRQRLIRGHKRLIAKTATSRSESRPDEAQAQSAVSVRKRTEVQEMLRQSLS